MTKKINNVVVGSAFLLLGVGVGLFIKNFGTVNRSNDNQKVVENMTESVPVEIDNLFKKINLGLSSNFPTTSSDKFYSLSGDIDKKSWNLDFTSSIKDKSQIVVVKNVMEGELALDLTKSAGGAGQTVEAYNGKEITCFLLLGIEKKSIVSCSLK